MLTRIAVCSGEPAGVGPELCLRLSERQATWPSARAHAWRTLARARAIENLCYVAGVNRVGRDGNGLHYAGDSAVLLTSPQIRPYVRSIIERFRGQTVVMSQNEVHPKAKLRTLGQV